MRGSSTRRALPRLAATRGSKGMPPLPLRSLMLAGSGSVSGKCVLLWMASCRSGGEAQLARVGCLPAQLSQTGPRTPSPRGQAAAQGQPGAPHPTSLFCSQKARARLQSVPASSTKKVAGMLQPGVRGGARRVRSRHCHAQPQARVLPAERPAPRGCSNPPLRFLCLSMMARIATLASGEIASSCCTADDQGEGACRANDSGSCCGPAAGHPLALQPCLSHDLSQLHCFSHTHLTVRTMNWGVSSRDSTEPLTAGGADDAQTQSGAAQLSGPQLYQLGPRPAHQAPSHSAARHRASCQLSHPLLSSSGRACAGMAETEMDRSPTPLALNQSAADQQPSHCKNGTEGHDAAQRGCRGHGAVL